MGQSKYSQNAVAGQPGQPFDNELSAADIVSVIAAAAIAFGSFCELNSSGLLVPMQDATAIAGTVATTNGSAAITFSAARTLSAGQAIIFAQQPSITYYLAANVAASTSGTLTVAYSGTSESADTMSVPFAPQSAGIAMGGEFSAEQGYTAFSVPASSTGSSSSGWLAGQSVSVMRRGRIWVLADATGTSLRTGNINVHHSSTGAHSQGVFTFGAVSPTVGNEIDVAPGCTVWNPALLGGAMADSFGNTFTSFPVQVHL